MAGKLASSNHPRPSDPIPKFEAIDDVQPADDTSEGRKIALVMWLWGAVKSVAGPARVETGRRPAYIAAREATAIDLIAQRRIIADGALLGDGRRGHPLFFACSGTDQL